MSSARPMPDTSVGWQFQTSTARPSTTGYGTNPIDTTTTIIAASTNNSPAGGDTGYMEMQMSNVAVAATGVFSGIQMVSNAGGGTDGEQWLHYKGQNTASYNPESSPSSFGFYFIAANATTAVNDGVWYHFPLALPLHYANSTHDVGVSQPGINEANGRAYIAFNSRFAHPEYFPTGHSMIVYYSSNSTGGQLGLTEGTTSDGNWVQLANWLDSSFQTVVESWHWQLGIEMEGNVWGARIIAVDFAYGNSTVKNMIIEDFMFTTTTNEQLAFANPWVANIRVPAGSNLYCRAQSSGAVNATFYVYAYGVVG